MTHYELVFRTREVSNLFDTSLDNEDIQIIRFEKISEADNFYHNWLKNFSYVMGFLGEYNYIQRSNFPTHSMLVPNYVKRHSNEHLFTEEKHGIRMVYRRFFVTFELNRNISLEVFVRLEK